MNCMKCGRETSDDMAFCPACLEDAKKYPVKPDVVIKLPEHHEAPQRKTQPRKRTRTPDEQLKHLKKINRALVAVIAFLLTATILLTSISIDFFRQLDVQRLLGQNYSTAETTN